MTLDVSEKIIWLGQDFAWISQESGYWGSFGMNRDSTLNGKAPRSDRAFSPHKAQSQ
jgi:hypothetical protein